MKEVARRSKTAKLVAKADMGCLFGQNVQVFLCKHSLDLSVIHVKVLFTGFFVEQYIPLSFDRRQPCLKIIQSDASRLTITHALSTCYSSNNNFKDYKTDEIQNVTSYL